MRERPFGIQIPFVCARRGRAVYDCPGSSARAVATVGRRAQQGDPTDAVQLDCRAQRQFMVAPANAVTAHGHGCLASPEQASRLRSVACMFAYKARDGATDLTCFARQHVADDLWGVAQPARLLCHRFQCEPVAADDNVVHALENRVIRLWCIRYFKRVHNVIVGSNRLALEAMAQEARLKIGSSGFGVSGISPRTPRSR